MSIAELSAGDALIVVDVQRDFLPGGALPVPGGDAVVEPLNICIDAFRHARLPILYTRDWHPANHCSFRAQGGAWPAHCVAGTPGADFAPGLNAPGEAEIVSKATTAEREAYSGFEGTDLGQRLRRLGVRRLFVAGLATDYCVRATVLDALREGFDVVALTDAMQPVEVHAGDGARALEEMGSGGASFATARDGPAGGRPDA
jgi:nicotinamidase/pyrazinamidase